MILLNNLYTIVARDFSDNKIKFDIKLDANHFIYQAHWRMHYPDCQGIIGGLFGKTDENTSS